MNKAILTTLVALAVSSGEARAHDPFHRDTRLTEREKAVANLSGAYAGVTDPDNRAHVAALAPGIFVAPWLWTRGSVLSACFWNGSEELRKAFISIATEWSKYGGLLVAFEPNGSTKTCQAGAYADVRISLDTDDTRDLWGDAEFPKAVPYGRLGKLNGSLTPLITLNIPAASVLQTDNPGQFRFLVLHEMGHVWGMLHEHQRGLCDQWYDEKAIEADTGFTQAQFRAAFDSLQSLGSYNLTYSGPYDKLSIMQYNFPSTWFKAGAGNPCLRPDIFDLSQGDKTTAGMMYGPPQQNAVADQVQQRLQQLTRDAEKLADAKKDEYDAVKKTMEIRIEQVSRPRKECVHHIEDGRRSGIACFDKPLESKELDFQRSKFEDNINDAKSDYERAKRAATSLRALQEAHRKLQTLD